nr:very short patch repair endonuclease [Nitrosospira multiformis]
MSPRKRSELMSRIRGKNTSPELKLRRALWAIGLRYRLYQRIGRAKPDLVFKRAQLAVFVDGCFWHQCPLHSAIPQGNRTFWQAKLGRNVERDMETNDALTTAGWEVLRFWEHDIDISAELCARKVEEVIASRLSGTQREK